MMFSKKKERHKTIEEVARALWRPSKPPLMQDQRTDPVAQHLVQMSVISPNTEIPHAPWPHVPEFGHPLCTTYILNLTKLPLVAIFRVTAGVFSINTRYWMNIENQSLSTHWLQMLCFQETEVLLHGLTDLSKLVNIAWISYIKYSQLTIQVSSIEDSF